MTKTQIIADIDLSGLNRRFSAARLRQARDGLGEQVLADMIPFIPKRHGTLRAKTDYNRARGSIESRTPYAQAQFRGKFKRNKKMTPKQRAFWFANKDELLKNRGYYTPGTSPRWDLKAKSRYGRQWRQQTADFLTKE